MVSKQEIPMLKKLFVVSLCLSITSCANYVLDSQELKNSAPSRTESDTEYRMGMHYLIGRGVEQNYAEAITFFEKSAERNNPYAEAELGYLYSAGKGVPKDYHIAKSWYQKAANHDLASAQFNLGLMYEHGLGTPVNHALAEQWYQKAAAHGFEPARRALTGH